MRAGRDPESAIEASNLALSKWLVETYQRVTDDFAVRTLERMARGERTAKPNQVVVKAKPISIRGKQLSRDVINFLGGPTKAGKTVDVWQKNVNRWLRNNAGTKITGQISATTLDSVRAKLKAGVAAGEGIDELAARIDNLYLDQVIPNRSEVIARTEVISASNLGGQEASRAAAEVVGFKLVKRWLSTSDDRTRDEHSDVNGQEVGMDEPFLVKDPTGKVYKLQFPGDSSLGAPGSVVIQCRCTATYHRAKGGAK